MSISITTDVFCDFFEHCGSLLNCYSGVRPNARLARKIAKSYGWSCTRRGDFCPECDAKIKEAKLAGLNYIAFEGMELGERPGFEKERVFIPNLPVPGLAE